MAKKWHIESKKFLRQDEKDAGITRRQFLSVAALSGGALLLPGCESMAPSSFEGYSVFHETMVEMAWPEIKQAIKDGAIILLPVGIIEEHGPHMGLAIDIYQTYNWCKMTRRALETKGIKALIAPPIYWGISTFVRNYPGTFSVSGETMKGLIYDVHASLNSWGCKYVFSFSAHGDTNHIKIYQEAVQEAHDKLKMGAYYVATEGDELLNDSYALIIENAQTTEAMRAHMDTHAGAFETAEMVAYFPEEVNTKLAKTLKPSTEFAPNGYWGDPASFDQISSKEIKEWADGVTTKTVEAIERFLKTQSS